MIDAYLILYLVPLILGIICSKVLKNSSLFYLSFIPFTNIATTLMAVVTLLVVVFCMIFQLPIFRKIDNWIEK